MKHTQFLKYLSLLMRPDRLDSFVGISTWNLVHQEKSVWFPLTQKKNHCLLIPFLLMMTNYTKRMNIHTNCLLLISFHSRLQNRRLLPEEDLPVLLLLVCHPYRPRLDRRLQQMMYGWSLSCILIQDP